MRTMGNVLGATGLALVRLLAVVTAADVVLEIAFDRPAGWFWVDLRWMPDLLRHGLLLGFSAGVWLYRPCPPRLKWTARGVAGALAIGCAWDVVTFLELRSSGVLFGAAPVPASLPTALLLLWWAWRGAERVPVSGVRGWIGRRALDGGLLAPALIAHILVFGATDYRRPADAAVVFGAAVSPTGEPSLSLADRTRTAAALYRAGMVKYLVLSGGHDPADPISEPEAMRRLAMELGVPESAIILDESGVNTLATVKRAVGLARERDWRSVLMVSQGWHLARIKLFSERQGLRCYTVPAMETRPLHRESFYVMRESAAILWYWLRPATFA